MTTTEKLAYLRINKSGLHSYQTTADFKDAIPNQMTFRGPFLVTTNVGKYCEPPFSFCNAFFDYDKRHVLWVGVGRFQPGDVSSLFNVDPFLDSYTRRGHIWRIGEHSSLESVDLTLSQWPANCGRASVLLQGRHLSIMSVLYPRANPDEGSKPGSNIQLVQRGAEGPEQWSHHSAEEGRTVEGELLRGTGDNVKYVHVVRTTLDGGLMIDQMKESTFQQPQTTGSKLWKTFKVNCKADYRGSHQRALFTTSDRSGNLPKYHRLYICKVSPSSGAIHIEYIPLRADGSVDSTQDTVEAQSHSTVAIPSDPNHQGLTALSLSEGTGILMWEQKAKGENAKVRAMGFKVPKDGAVPDASAWTSIDVQLPNVQDSSDETKSTAVVVPEDFTLD